MTAEPTWGESADIWARCARAEAVVSRVRALAEEWAAEGPGLVIHAYSPRDVHEGQTLERCAADLRAALGDPA